MATALKYVRNILDGLTENEFEADKATVRDIQAKALSCNLSWKVAVLNGEDSDEFRYINTLFPEVVISDDCDHFHGLIALSESGMSDLQNFSQATVHINLDDLTVDFDEMFERFKNKEEFLEELNEEYFDDEKEFMPNLDQVNEWKYNLKNCTFDYFRKAAEEILKNPDEYIFKEKEGYLRFHWI